MISGLDRRLRREEPSARRITTAKRNAEDDCRPPHRRDVDAVEDVGCVLKALQTSREETVGPPRAIVLELLEARRHQRETFDPVARVRARREGLGLPERARRTKAAAAELLSSFTEKVGLAPR